VSARAALALALALGLAAGGCGGPPPVQSAADSELVDWQARTAQLRGLGFERPLELVRIAPERIPELMRRQIEQDFSPELARRTAAAYGALGLLPAEFDLYQALLDIYGMQVAGLYDPRESRLYVREGELPGGAGYSTEVVAVHELVHALQHQHFPQTIALQLGLQHSGDLSIMLSVVTEGDASLASFALSPSHGRAPAQLRAVRDAMMAELDRASGPYAAAPRPLRLRFVVPYAEGLLLAAQEHERGGQAALDAWLRDPPLSTLPLLAPQAPARAPEWVGLPLEWLAGELAPAQCELGHHDVIGPLMIAALLREHGLEQPDPIAAGWSGDRLLYASCAGRPELLWYTRWESAAAAARFAAAYLEVAPRIARVPGARPALELSASDRTVVLRTPRFEALGPALEERIELRSYAQFSDWLAAACFPEPGCPSLER
jgi:hypothetical protein